MKAAFQRLAAATVAVCAALTAAPALAQNKEVKFALDFIPLGRHAPWYVALDKGYFREEKLDVAILPTKGTADGIRYVEAGLAEFGFIDIPSLAAAGSAGGQVRIVAVSYQKPPYCLFSLNPGANVQAPKDLVGLELGSSTASFMPRVWSAFMKMNNLDPSTLKIVNIEPAARVPMLVSGKVQAIDNFLMSEPGIRRAATGGAQPKCLLLGDYGLDLYSNSVGVRADFLKANPEAVKGFVRAAMRGWKDAMANPEEAAKIQVKYLKALDPAIIVEELKLLQRIAVTPEVKEKGYGTMNLEKMKRTVDFVNNNIDVTGAKLKAEDFYVEGYLPSPAIKP